jgi:hypothetical protein
LFTLVVLWVIRVSFVFFVGYFVGVFGWALLWVIFWVLFWFLVGDSG